MSSTEVDGAGGAEVPDAASDVAARAEDYELAAAAWYAMYRIWSSEESTRRGVAAAASEDLTAQQFAALLSLPVEVHRGLRMRELAERCHSTPSYITAVVDALEARGLAERRPHADDRRVTEVRLTDHGRGAAARAHAALSVPPEGLLDLSSHELRTLRDLLDRAAERYA